MSELDAFHQELFQDIHREAHAEGAYAEDAFFDQLCEHLVEAGELETADRAHYVSPRGLRIDGYGGDPNLAEGVLSLIVADFSQDQQMRTLTATEMDAIFRRGTAFLTKALDPAFRRSLEETSPVFGLADMISSSWANVHKVRLFLISNRVLSAKVDGREAGVVGGKPVTYGVWDLGRLFRYVASGRSREEIVVELADHGGPLQALPAHLTDAGYESYLLVVPGRQLASIYGRWGSRLLEQNVRVFLQARGNVNKGIKTTLDTDPQMFFAYNNGLTATAEEVIGEEAGGSLIVTGLRNLQIVNGGQTTASIYAASLRKTVDLAKVFVQMKLSVIPHERAELVVPKISEYANSQNKVNAADFFANHPFHLRMKEFSQTMFAPSADGTFRESKWFYERARGQYQDARGGLSVAERKKFELEYPKSQVFSKTDLAKFVSVWEGRPHIVSRGAQKNFADFASLVGKAWEAQADEFNEAYFRHLVAKAIVFRSTEDLVTKQPWYEGGYRANIVAYAIAKLAHDVEQSKRAVNFEGIWRAQAISSGMQDALTLSAKEVTQVLTSPPAGLKNVTEWAKQQACWTRVTSLKIGWHPSLLLELLSEDEHKGAAKAAVRDQKVLNGIEAQSLVVKAGARFWKDLMRWASENECLTGKELQIIDVAASMPRTLPTEKQSIVIIKALDKARTEGFPFSLDAS